MQKMDNVADQFQLKFYTWSKGANWKFLMFWLLAATDWHYSVEALDWRIFFKTRKKLLDLGSLGFLDVECQLRKFFVVIGIRKINATSGSLKTKEWRLSGQGTGVSPRTHADSLTD